jgi:hypothetical protein
VKISIRPGADCEIAIRDVASKMKFLSGKFTGSYVLGPAFQVEAIVLRPGCFACGDVVYAQVSATTNELLGMCNERACIPLRQFCQLANRSIMGGVRKVVLATIDPKYWAKAACNRGRREVHITELER